MFYSPVEKLKALSGKNKPLLWVVCYVNQTGKSPLVEEARQDIEASVEGGADGVVLINEWSSLQELESTLQTVRSEYPHVKMGVNYLGDEAEPYGYRDSFRLAREYNLQMVWTDFSGVDQINEKPDVSLHEIQSQRPESVFYCSGIHMKYSTLRNSQKTIEESALQAMGWVDGIIVTGPKTGVATDPETVTRARQVIGDYPLGVASGVSAQNIPSIRNQIDFCLVASSLQNEQKRIVKQKVRELATELSK
jgi:hypothetical protein